MIWTVIILLVAVLDQGVKYVVKHHVNAADPIVVIRSFFYITNHENRGAAFGIFQNGRIFFILLTIVLLAVLGYFLYRYDNKVLRLSLSFIIGGALGNFMDRVISGGVVDFLDFYFGSYNFPTFNVADSFIVIGSILLSYYLLFVYKDEDELQEKE